MMKKLLLILFISVDLYSAEATHPMKELEHYASVLNIEGGRIQKCLSENQHWANLAIVLDTPFSTSENRITYDELNAKLERDKEFNYTMKERYIPSFNEFHYQISTIAGIDFMLNKFDHVLIVVHRGVAARAHIEKLILGLRELYKDKGFEVHRNEFLKGQVSFQFKFNNSPKVISFMHGYDVDTIENPDLYNGYECIFSVSLLAALNPQLEPGQLIIPNHFRKAFLGENISKVCNAIYTTNNFISDNFDEIFSDDNITRLSDKLKSIPFSENLEKNHFMSDVPLSRRLFLRDVVVLEVDGLFSPETSAPEFLLI